MKTFAWHYVFLGIALTEFADLDMFGWKFWAILIPFSILNLIYDEANK